MFGLIVLAIKLLVVIKIRLFIGSPKTFILCLNFVINAGLTFTFDFVKFIQDVFKTAVDLLIEVLLFVNDSGVLILVHGCLSSGEFSTIPRLSLSLFKVQCGICCYGSNKPS
jgi:hypothetical protein